MKSVFKIAGLLALVTVGNLAHADAVDQVASAAAITEVNRQLFIHQSNLNDSATQMMAHFGEPGGAPQAVIISRLASKSEIDSTVLVRIAYSNLSSMSEAGSLLVKVKVASVIDDRTSNISRTRATVDNKSIELMTELPLD